MNELELAIGQEEITFWCRPFRTDVSVVLEFDFLCLAIKIALAGDGGRHLPGGKERPFGGLYRAGCCRLSECSTIDFDGLVEQEGMLESILQQDPDGTYGRMTLESGGITGA